MKSLHRSLRAYASGGKPNLKVSVLGAAGGIGQPMSLLLKGNPKVGRLALFDIVNTPGVAADISHVNTPAKVTGHVGEDELGECLDGSDVVVIPAGVPRKPGMTRDDLFNTNASIVHSLAMGVGKHSPNAKVLVISNPVNSTVPIVAEALKKSGVYNPRNLFGVTTLDVVRARTFVAEAKGLDPVATDVSVIGGHAGTTILPLLSQLEGVEFTPEEAQTLTTRIQFGGDEVVQAKAGLGSATLSMAYAGAEFTDSVLAALGGHDNVIKCSFVQQPEGTVLADGSNPMPLFFSTLIRIGTEGVADYLPVGPLNEFELKGLKDMLPDLNKSIQKGIDFASNAQ